jgi:hypothetical protein
MNIITLSIIISLFIISTILFLIGIIDMPNKCHNNNSHFIYNITNTNVTVIYSNNTKKYDINDYHNLYRCILDTNLIITGFVIFLTMVIFIIVKKLCNHYKEMYYNEIKNKESKNKESKNKENYKNEFIRVESDDVMNSMI